MRPKRGSLPGPIRRSRCLLTMQVVTFEEALAQADRVCVQLAPGDRGAALCAQPMPMLLPEVMATPPETIAMPDYEMSEATSNLKQLITQ